MAKDSELKRVVKEILDELQVTDSGIHVTPVGEKPRYIESISSDVARPQMSTPNVSVGFEQSISWGELSKRPQHPKRGDIFVVTQVGADAAATAAGTLYTCFTNGTWSQVSARNKVDATAAPTVNDDLADGYAVGSIWIDVTNDNVYICLDNTLTAAVWAQIDAAGHDSVTLAGIPDYITISGQVITRGQIDLTADVTGDLPIAEGGTGQSTAQAAIDALTAVSGATNEHVLTKDTATGNAVFKAAAGGGSVTQSKFYIWFIPGSLSAVPVQGPIHLSGGTNETVVAIVGQLGTAAGTGGALTFTIDFDNANSGGAAIAVDTEIEEVAMGTGAAIRVTSGFTNSTLNADSLVALSIDTVTMGTATPADLYVIMETEVTLS